MIRGAHRYDYIIVSLLEDRSIRSICAFATSAIEQRRYPSCHIMAAPADQRIAVPIDDPNADTEWHVFIAQ